MNDNYPYKHWFSTILAGCLLLAAYYWLSGDNKIMEPGGIFYFSILFGFLFSLPSLLVYLLFFWFMVKKPYPVRYLKMIFIAFVVAEIVTTFLVMGGGLLNQFVLVYSLAAIISGILLRLGPKDPGPKGSQIPDIN